ncbi:MAG: RNA polymerase sigma factor [Planctomycetaceae bacterium]
MSEPDAPAAAAPDDLRLVAACLAEQRGAWEEFVGRFARLFGHVAARTAARRGIDLGAAERDDAVAEVILACLRTDAAVLRAYAGRASLATYLAVIARRVIVRGLVRPAVASATAAATPEPAAGRDEAGEAADRDEVAALLDLLDAREATLVRLHHLEGRSYGEISRLTGMPLGSIGPALSRAKARLRALRDAG